MATWRRDRIITIWENAADDRTHRDNEQEEGSIARPRIAQAPTREGPRINDLIEVPRVRLIDENGEQVGIVPVREALAKAQAVGLDLVEISPNVDPPVCKILDYGKYKYEEQKRKIGRAHV